MKIFRNKNNQTLTDRKYWEAYYNNSITSRDEIIRICSKYDEIFEILIKSCYNPPAKIIEIGAYPGRFLAYLSYKYSLKATALDFNSDRSKIIESFSSMGAVLEEIIQDDFLQYDPVRKYDIVLSNGFIEHFTNFNEVLDRHVKYLNPGGAMLIMIPNKKYLRKWYGLLVDYKNLKAHNLKCMSLDVFRDFAHRNNMIIKYLGYKGGFAYRVHQDLNIFQKIIYKIARAAAIILNPFFEAHPHPFYSGSIVGIFQKPHA